MDISGGSIKIFGCNGNKSLAEHIASDLGLALGKSEIGKFSDGEISVRINETVRGADVFIVQPTSNPVNDNLMELLITIDAVKRGISSSGWEMPAVFCTNNASPGIRLPSVLRSFPLIAAL